MLPDDPFEERETQDELHRPGRARRLRFGPSGGWLECSITPHELHGARSSPWTVAATPWGGVVCQRNHPAFILDGRVPMVSLRPAEAKRNGSQSDTFQEDAMLVGRAWPRGRRSTPFADFDSVHREPFRTSVERLTFEVMLTPKEATCGCVVPSRRSRVPSLPAMRRVGTRRRLPHVRTGSSTDDRGRGAASSGLIHEIPPRGLGMHNLICGIRVFVEARP
jgi:hypothetical protein